MNTWCTLLVYLHDLSAVLNISSNRREKFNKSGVNFSVICIFFFLINYIFSLFSFWSCARQHKFRLWLDHKQIMMDVQEHKTKTLFVLVLLNCATGCCRHVFTYIKQLQQQQKQQYRNHLLFNWFLNCFSGSTMIPYVRLMCKCDFLFRSRLVAEKRRKKEYVVRSRTKNYTQSQHCK